jgi:hypothetical protein
MAVAGETWSVGARTLLQQEVDSSHLGRVTGAYGALGSLSVLAGLAVATLAGGTANSTMLLAVVGGLNLLAAVVGTLMLRPGAY